MHIIENSHAVVVLGFFGGGGFVLAVSFSCRLQDLLHLSRNGLKCPCQKMRVWIFQINNKKYNEIRKQNQNCYFALKVIAVKTLDLAFRKV